MKIIKFIVIEILLLIAMLVCGTATIVILYILFKLGNEDVGGVGLKVGFIAWLSLLVVTAIVKLKNKHILSMYRKEIDVKKYSEKIRNILEELKKEYNYSELDSMLVLKDILYHEWKDKK